jgi:hypothetical protein
MLLAAWRMRPRGAQLAAPKGAGEKGARLSPLAPVHARPIRRFAPAAERRPKCHFSRARTVPCTVAAASRNDEADARPGQDRREARDPAWWMGSGFP